MDVTLSRVVNVGFSPFWAKNTYWVLVFVDLQQVASITNRNNKKERLEKKKQQRSPYENGG